MVVGGLTKTRRVMCSTRGSTQDAQGRPDGTRYLSPRGLAPPVVSPSVQQGAKKECQSGKSSAWSSAQCSWQRLVVRDYCESEEGLRHDHDARPLRLRLPPPEVRFSLVSDWAISPYPLIPNSSPPSLKAFPDPSFMLPQSLPMLLSVMSFRQIISNKHFF